jgi:hypothetical protein
MYHYVNSITNTRGDALTGFFVKAIDKTAGSTAPIFADESSTPIAVVSGVTDAAQVDQDGNASFYIDSGEYHLDIYATDSTTFIKRIENVPMVTAGDFVTPIQLADEGAAATIGASGGGTVQDGLDRIGAFVGYDTGSGSTVIQSTSKSTTVNLNALCGQITMNNAALAASTSVVFSMNNNFIASTDVVAASISSGATATAYNISVTRVSSGSCAFHVRNVSGGSLSEALVINFAVIKAVAA